ncbi:MAG: substrate-binding domain-containing protein [Planctomycetota bacterium]
MPGVNELGPVTAEAGTPLYVAVKNRLIEAIRDGQFKPGDRLPSTQEISKLLQVSLVTSHRALQELEQLGTVDRVQGRGTFVAEPDRAKARQLRLKLVFQPEASLADYYHGQVLEGMNRGTRESDCELSIIQDLSRTKAACDGYILLNPLESQVAAIRKAVRSDTPILIVGARHESLPWIDVDNEDAIDQAVQHAIGLGHERIAFIGGADELSNSRDRRRGFVRACERLGLPADHRHDVIAHAYRLDREERDAVTRLLGMADRPTAIVTGGYHLALDLYTIANTLALEIPSDLSLIGVDDPPSAAHLDPPMTTLQQPLVQLGHAAVHRLVESVQTQSPLPPRQSLRATLAIRRSSGAR